jgi:hypothetical protein
MLQAFSFATPPQSKASSATGRDDKCTATSAAASPGLGSSCCDVLMAGSYGAQGDKLCSQVCSIVVALYHPSYLGSIRTHIHPLQGAAQQVKQAFDANKAAS